MVEKLDWKARSISELGEQARRNLAAHNYADVLALTRTVKPHLWPLVAHRDGTLVRSATDTTIKGFELLPDPSDTTGSRQFLTPDGGIDSYGELRDGILVLIERMGIEGYANERLVSRAHLAFSGLKESLEKRSNSATVFTLFQRPQRKPAGI